uniref:U3 small nucleolar RNA-associated protein 6 homolog n=1 Tax=Anopheles farauti TaxID=69004 RepID=A0A182QYS9_9DIPT
MAEIIEKRREQAIREYECMKHLKLFTDNEIRDIKNKRNYHDYKVERRSKRMGDFVNYIAYECNLFQLLLQRRKKLNVRAEWVSLEKSIHQRIKVLYKRALHRFASDYRIWTHFLQYCKMRHFYIEGSRVLEQMLGYHGDKTKAWLCAIQWEYTQAQNMTRAKHFTLRGLQRLPDSRELCLYFIGIQLAEAEKCLKESSKPLKQLLEEKHVELSKALQTVQVVYRSFEHKNMAFFRELLEKLKDYRPLVGELAKEAIATMRETLAEKEEMWDLLANLTLEGDEFVLEQKTELVDRIQKCTEIYREALEALPTKKMHSLCIETMLKINSLENATADAAKAMRKALANAYKRALNADLLEEEKLLQYLKLLLHNPKPNAELVMTIINKGLEQYPLSLEVWSAYLRYVVSKEISVDELQSIFRQASNALPDSVTRLPLWQILFQYYNSKPSLREKCEELYRHAIDQEPEISHHFQPLYLEYLAKATSSNIAKVRREYQRLVKNYTTTLELHQKMASLEAKQQPPDVCEWRKCHEHATQFYGKTDPSVWLQYIQFERDHGKAQYMQSLYVRAKAALDEESFGIFLPQYEIIHNPYIVRY